MNAQVTNEAAEACVLASGSPKATALAGASLAESLYATPLTIALLGDLGAGKTTFLRGFFEALGAETAAISPTYALEQRHRTRHGEAIHLDLYRLNPKDAREILSSSDEHPGIRAVEWFDRTEKDSDSDIVIAFSEEADRDRRTIRFEFHDAPTPPRAFVTRLRNEMRLPPHVAAHCDAVAGLCDTLADALIARGTVVRKTLLRRAAELHDLFRFVDFRPEGGPAGFRPSTEEEALWAELRARYPDKRHEAACAAFLRENGYEALGQIVETHGLALPEGVSGRGTIEQKLLYYADKRVNQTEVVTLQERFDDFLLRYGHGKDSTKSRAWHDEAAAMERELFPDGAPNA